VSTLRSAVAAPSAAAEIRTFLDDWAGAVRAMDIDRIFSHYAPDIVAFDAISQLQFKGTDAYRRHWKSCLALCKPGTMIFEVREPTIAAAEDLAFCHALTRCGALDESGEEKSGWMRMTAGYRRVGGRWWIVHEHFSAPFDMQTLKILDLAP
jgi:ketosteroid isomerase-like protein